MIALKGVLKHAGNNISSPVRTRVYDHLRDLILHDDDQVRVSSAKILGITSQVCRRYLRRNLLFFFPLLDVHSFKILFLSIGSRGLFFLPLAHSTLVYAVYGGGAAE